MNIISPLEIFIALFIGMGPIKVLLVFIAMTEGMEKSVRRKMAKRTAMIAGIVALGLFLLGAILQALLHFSIGSLTSASRLSGNLRTSRSAIQESVPETGESSRLHNMFSGRRSTLACSPAPSRAEAVRSCSAARRSASRSVPLARSWKR